MIIFEVADRIGGKIHTSYSGTQTMTGADGQTAVKESLLAVGAGGDGEVHAGETTPILGASSAVPQELGACCECLSVCLSVCSTRFSVFGLVRLTRSRLFSD